MFADRSRTFAEALARRLDLEPELIMVAVITEEHPDWEILTGGEVDVALVDARLAVDLIGALPGQWCRGVAPHVVVLGDSSDAGICTDLVRRGATGWVSREESIATLVETIRAVCRGEARLPPLLLPRILDELSAWQGRTSTVAGDGATLTQREGEILRLLAQGFSRADIAAYLHLSPNTVRTHVQHILNRLGVHSSLAAVAKVAESHSSILHAAEPIGRSSQ